MRWIQIFGTVFLATGVLTASAAQDKGSECGMFLSKSSGYEHSCIKWDASKVSYVDNVLQGLTDRLGINILCTKDASLINADNLAKYKVVVFYTTGDLTTEGNDKEPPMKTSGVDDLLTWIRDGGGFVGFRRMQHAQHFDG